MTELNLHQLTGAYVLDALDEDEVAQFAAHLDECESCLAECAGLARTVVRLADLVAEEPPAALRARVLEAADRTRQLPPVVTDLDAARRRRRRVASGIAAALVAAAVAIGVVVVTNNEPSQSDIIAGVVQAPDSRTFTDDVSGGGAATVIFAPSKDAGVVKLQNLPALSSDKAYELWLFDESGTPHNAGVFVPSTGGSATEILEDAADTTAMAITVEPASGSDAPTSTPILIVSWT